MLRGGKNTSQLDYRIFECLVRNLRKGVRMPVLCFLGAQFGSFMPAVKNGCESCPRFTCTSTVTENREVPAQPLGQDLLRQ